MLRASDIVGLDIRADLAVLSACSTAPSGEDGAEPLAGLAAAFMAAGVKTVMASHWQVASNPARELTTTVISSMFKHGLDAANAMEQARRKVRSNDILAHPVFWAPFEIIGFPGASKLHDQLPAAARRTATTVARPQRHLAR